MTTDQIQVERLQLDKSRRQYLNLNTPELFLAKVKELFVITVHKSVHPQNFWKMLKQSEPDEQTRSFIACITFTA